MKQGVVDSAKISLVVGTILCVINQWESIAAFSFDLGTLIRMALNYIVPFSVASYSKFQVDRQNRKKERL